MSDNTGVKLPPDPAITRFLLGVTSAKNPGIPRVEQRLPKKEIFIERYPVNLLTQEREVQQMSDSNQSTQPMFLRVGYMAGGLLLAVGALLAVVMDTPPIRGGNESLWLQKGIEEEKTKQAQALAEQARYSGGRTVRPSEVPVHLRAESFSSVSVSVPCTSGGAGLESEGLNRPTTLSSGFELEPGKCFFARPVAKAKQLEGNNAFMELYDATGSLKGRCEFTQASIASCSELHDQAVAGQGVIRFGTRYGGFIKYWV